MRLQASKLKKISTYTRVNEWKWSFVPFILGNLYLWLFLFEIEPVGHTFFILILSIITLFGFAASGYVINEWSDIEDDRIAGKNNKLALLSSLYKIVLLILVLSVCLLPWFYLPYNQYSLIFIIAQFTSYILYSAKPFRFKNRLIGLVLDALYAYIIPMLLSCYTFYLFSSKGVFPLFLIGLYAAVLALTGTRNILLHQINDRPFDIKLNDKNFIAKRDASAVNRILLAITVAEIIFYGLFLLVLSNYNLYMSLLLGAVYLYFIFQFFKSTINRAYKDFGVLYNKQYQLFQPIIFLLILLSYHLNYLPVLILHVLLFVPAYTYLPTIKYLAINVIGQIFIYIKWGLSLVINYIIYFIFLCFGINLIKRKQSAFQAMKCLYNKNIRK
jgi:hypothetical protein